VSGLRVGFEKKATIGVSKSTKSENLIRMVSVYVPPLNSVSGRRDRVPSQKTRTPKSLPKGALPQDAMVRNRPPIESVVGPPGSCIQVRRFAELDLVIRRIGLKRRFSVGRHAYEQEQDD
jgi:hypothetical protein